MSPPAHPDFVQSGTRRAAPMHALCNCHQSLVYPTDACAAGCGRRCSLGIFTAIREGLSRGPVVDLDQAACSLCTRDVQSVGTLCNCSARFRPLYAARLIDRRGQRGPKPVHSALQGLFAFILRQLRGAPRSRLEQRSRASTGVHQELCVALEACKACEPFLSRAYQWYYHWWYHADRGHGKSGAHFQSPPSVRLWWVAR